MKCKSFSIGIALIKKTFSSSSITKIQMVLLKLFAYTKFYLQGKSVKIERRGVVVGLETGYICMMFRQSFFSWSVLLVLQLLIRFFCTKKVIVKARAFIAQISKSLLFERLRFRQVFQTPKVLLKNQMSMAS